MNECEVYGAFGHWLAGFIDGEATFVIERDNGHRRGETVQSPTYKCSFALALRMDDLPILEECRRRLRLGHIRYRPSKGNSKPIARWEIRAKSQCAELCRLLEAHPLRTKKATDFTFWKAALRLWLSVEQCGRVGRPDVWAQMATLKEAMEESRRYDVEVEPDIAEQDHSQLRLISNN